MPTGRLNAPCCDAYGVASCGHDAHRRLALHTPVVTASSGVSTGAPRSPRSSVLRTARRAGIVVTASITVLGLVPAVSQAEPAPTIAQVTDQVDALYLQMSAAVEDFDEANVRAAASRDRLATLHANLDRLQDGLDAATAEAGALASAQYQSAGFDPTVQMLLSGDSGDFLTRVSQLDQVANRQADTLANLSTAKSELAAQELAVERETTRLDDLTATLQAAKTEAEAKHQAAEDLLAELTAAEQARVAAEQAARAAAAEAAQQAAMSRPTGATGAGAGAGTAPSAPTQPAPPVSGRAGVAVAFAMAQIGDSYVYGATGPNSWDCSGLTMGAWGAAGVSLPHSSRAQAGMGVAVSSGDLQPGDLVFYYSPISHVGIYIGNGQIVHASNPSKPVGIAPVFSMPFSGARRVG